MNKIGDSFGFFAAHKHQSVCLLFAFLLFIFGQKVMRFDVTLWLLLLLLLCVFHCCLSTTACQRLINTSERERVSTRAFSIWWDRLSRKWFYFGCRFCGEWGRFIILNGSHQTSTITHYLNRLSDLYWLLFISLLWSALMHECNAFKCEFLPIKSLLNVI